jgi:hypothetical protein
VLARQLHIGIPPTRQADVPARYILHLLKELNRPAEEILKVHQINREFAHFAVNWVGFVEVVSASLEILEKTVTVVVAMHAFEKQGTVRGIEVYRPLAAHACALLIAGNSPAELS